MDLFTHKPWRRAVVGALCVFAGQSVYIWQRPPSGPGMALAFALAIFGGILIIGALLDDTSHPRSH